MSDKDHKKELWQDTDSDVVVEDDRRVEPPKRWKVLLINDDYTTMEFVVHVLTNIFHLSEQRAIEIMLHVHQRGAGVAGVYSYDIAETKVRKVTELARENEFPLRCQLEPE